MLATHQGMLVINKLKPTDEATYTCRGSNNDGITDGNIELDLYECETSYLIFPGCLVRHLANNLDLFLIQAYISKILTLRLKVIGVQTRVIAVQIRNRILYTIH